MVRLRRFIAPTVLAAALAAALLMQGTREIASMAGKAVLTSYLKACGESVGTYPWTGVPERIADAHANDPLILQGLAEDPSSLPGRFGLYERALELRPSYPGLHAGLICLAIPEDWPGKPSEAPKFRDDWEEREFLQRIKLVEEHSKWGMKHDPENAFFQCAQACADAAVGDKSAAREHFIAASQKQRFDAYMEGKTRAYIRASFARGMTRLETLNGMPFLDTSIYDALGKLSRDMAAQARDMEAKGRPSESLRIDLALVRLGRLIQSGSSDNFPYHFASILGFEILLKAGPQIPTPELIAAQQPRYVLQWPLFERYLLSNGLPGDEVRRIQAVFEAARQEAHDTMSGAMAAEQRFSFTSNRAYGVLFVVALFLYSAIGFTMLGLALNPLVRSLTRRDIEPVAWSTWTSLVLWVLVLTPLLATIVFYARNPGLLWIFSRWTAHGNEIRASSTSALVGMIPVLLATMALLGCVIIAALRRSPEAFSERKTAATAGVLILLVVIEAWWLYSRASSSSEYSHLLPVDALVGFSMTLVFSALRGWIVSRRVPMMGIGEHFLASVLGSCRAVALGSAALFVASLYIALPFHLQAVSFIEQYIAK